MLTCEIKKTCKLSDGSMPGWSYNDFGTEMMNHEQMAINASVSFKYTLESVGALNEYVNKTVNTINMMSSEGWKDVAGKALNIFKTAVRAVIIALKQTFMAIINFFRFIGSYIKTLITGKEGYATKKVHEFVGKIKYGSRGMSAYKAFEKVIIKSVLPYSKIDPAFYNLEMFTILASGNNALINSFTRTLIYSIKDVSDNPGRFVDDAGDDIIPIIKTFNQNMEARTNELNKTVKFFDGDTRTKFNITPTAIETGNIIRSSLKRNTLIDDEDVSISYIKPSDMEDTDLVVYSSIFGDKVTDIPKTIDYKLFDFFETNDLVKIGENCEKIANHINISLADFLKRIQKMHNECEDILNVAIPALNKLESAIGKIDKPSSDTEEDNIENSKKFKLVMALFKAYINNLTTSIYALRAEHKFTMASYKVLSYLMKEADAWLLVVANTMNEAMKEYKEESKDKNEPVSNN